MKICLVLCLTFVGWGTGAPGRFPDPSNSDIEDSEGLGPALRDIARRKRESAMGVRPYSALRPLSGAFKYRYPLYRKRAFEYDAEDERYPEALPEEEENSFFRERRMLKKLQDFPSDDDKRKRFLPSANVPALVRKRNEYFTYEDGVPGPLTVLDQHPRDEFDISVNPSVLDRFYATMDEMQREKIEEEWKERQAEKEEEERIERLKEFLSSAARKYLMMFEDASNSIDEQDPLIRRRRDIMVPPMLSTNTSGTIETPDGPYPEKDMSRSKREFSDYFRWEKRNSEMSMEERKKKRQEFDDFLTREYFKTIARSVGNKKKRMAFGQFDATKRSDLDALLTDPEMLEYMQQRLKESENEVAEETRDILNNGQELPEEVEAAVGRLDAIEKMREALRQLEMLQDEEDEEDREKKKKRNFDDDDEMKKKRVYEDDRKKRYYEHEDMKGKQYFEDEERKKRFEDERRKKSSLEDENKRKKKSFEDEARKKISFEDEDKRKKSFGDDDRKKKSFEDEDRKKKSFEDEDRKKKSFEDEDRKKKSFEDEYKKKKSFEDEDRKKKSFEGEDRKKKSFEGEDRKKKSFEDDELRKKTFEDERKKKSPFEDKRRKKYYFEDEKRKRALTAEERRQKLEEFRRKHKRTGDSLLFLNESPDECSVLERMLLNCVEVSEITGDKNQVFLDSCVKHEACYMCGAGMGVTGHECNAFFSAALEASCEGDLECLSAAGQTYDMLSDYTRYDDDDGSCSAPSNDCVRDFLQTR